MLRFDTTHPVDTSGMSGDITQLIDISAYSGEVAAGTALASASVFFNRVAGDSQTDTQFDLTIRAYNGIPENLEYTAHLAESRVTLISDGDTGTWESLSTELLLPTNTSYAAVFLSAIENVWDDGANPFDGHYADDASFTMSSTIPEPSSVVALLGMGAVVALRFIRRRRRRA